MCNRFFFVNFLRGTMSCLQHKFQNRKTTEKGWLSYFEWCRQWDFFLLLENACVRTEWLPLELDFHCFSIGLLRFRLIFIGKLRSFSRTWFAGSISFSSFTHYGIFQIIGSARAIPFLALKSFLMLLGTFCWVMFSLLNLKPHLVIQLALYDLINLTDN